MGVVGVCGGTSGIETGISLEFSPITTVAKLVWLQGVTELIRCEKMRYRIESNHSIRELLPVGCES